MFEMVTECLTSIYDIKLVNICFNDLFLLKSSSLQKLILQTIFCDLDVK